MFKNLFNKKEEKPMEIPQDWVFYACKVDNNPASIRINLALDKIAPIADYHHRTWFSVKLKDPDENGLPTNEEFPKICQIEDDIVDALTAKGAIMVGALKSNGTFDLYLYSKNTDRYDAIMGEVMAKNHSDYQFATDFKEDAEWEDYFNFLYPNDYQYQSIQNRKVLFQLSKHEDNPEIEREIDHWLYFDSEANRENYIDEVQQIGYKVLSKDFRDDMPKNAYQLNISRVNSTIDIDDYVWELIEIAHKYNADYDGWGCPIAK
ncbi:DUF695 domain-containing protein [Paenimyroides aestuarii]|uniref:DUF695 domain-containing protein n=1 Tax=Paenimyroides aestuarii TaxID=2968490 RepID=A0ABY5NQT0_9FLAO|nr:DUF695 domain-containing protein [Paenimyroides aestuarii]UUV20861.1 DUF695 domain-containing protein [Paenimyroides aestuarii]